MGAGVDGVGATTPPADEVCLVGRMCSKPHSSLRLGRAVAKTRLATIRGHPPVRASLVKRYNFSSSINIASLPVRVCHFGWSPPPRLIATIARQRLL